MTAIVGIQGKDWAILASDSMTSYDDRPFYAKGMDKVTQRGEYTFAVAGDALAGDIANSLWTPPRVTKTMSTDDFVMTKVLPSFKAACVAYNYNPNNKEDKDAGFDMLLCINATIYQIDSGFGWMRDDRGLYAIGSGGELALGALAALAANEQSITNAQSIAERAIQISAEYNIYVGGELQLKTQKGK